MRSIVKICISKIIKFACSKKEHSEIILRIKGAILMFFVISNRSVQNLQNLNKNMIKSTKQTQPFPFIRQHYCATSLKINHKIPLPFLSLTSENKILPSCDHTLLKPYISLAFFNSTTPLFVRLSVMLTDFPLSFFLVLMY